MTAQVAKVSLEFENELNSAFSLDETDLEFGPLQTFSCDSSDSLTDQSMSSADFKLGWSSWDYSALRFLEPIKELCRTVRDTLGKKVISRSKSLSRMGSHRKRNITTFSMNSGKSLQGVVQSYLNISMFSNLPNSSTVGGKEYDDTKQILSKEKFYRQATSSLDYLPDALPLEKAYVSTPDRVRGSSRDLRHITSIALRTSSFEYERSRKLRSSQKRKRILERQMEATKRTELKRGRRKRRESRHRAIKKREKLNLFVEEGLGLDSVVEGVNALSLKTV